MERISYPEIPPVIFDKLRNLGKQIEQSSLSPILLEIIRLRVSQLNACAYCVDMHHKELKAAGETELRLSSLCVWKETPYFSKEERAVLSLVEEVNEHQKEEISDKTFEELRNYFSLEEICWISVDITLIRSWNVLMKMFRFTPGLYQVKED